MKIGLRDLELVYWLGERGSLTAASQSMHVSQPALSQRLANLRQQAGSELFERVDGQMRPTAAGERLLIAAGRIRKELATAKGDIEGLAQQKSQRLRISTACYTTYRWLPLVIRDMLKRYPDVHIDVVPEATDDPLLALNERRIDLAIVSDPPGKSGGQPNVGRPALFEDEFFAVMSAAHPLARRRFLNPKDFVDQSLVLYAGTRYPIVEEILNPAGVQPARIIDVRITEAIVELARAGKGIAILAGWVFNDLPERDSLAAVRITRGGFRRTWSAAIGSHCCAELAAAFVECVRRFGKLARAEDWRQRAEVA